MNNAFRVVLVTLLVIFSATFSRADSGSGLPPLPPISAPDLAQSQPGANTPTSTPAAPVSELQKYKTKFKQAVASRWYSKINGQNLLLSEGTLHIQYTIRYDGTVTSTLVKGAKPATMLLKTTSLEAIQQTSPYLPFSAALRQQVGDSLTATLTFTINRKDQGSIKSS
jgi:outer membrane biosynthesis protein TonB